MVYTFPIDGQHDLFHTPGFRSSVPLRNDAFWNDLAWKNGDQNDVGLPSHSNLFPDHEGSTSNRRASSQPQVNKSSMLEGSPTHASAQNPSQRVARRRNTVIDNTLPGSYVLPLPPSSSSSTTTISSSSSSTPALYTHQAPPGLPSQLENTTSSPLEDAQQDFLQQRRALAASFLHSDEPDVDSDHKHRAQVGY
jgi:hypothetical protein